jgi:hypothetical protein
VAYVATEGGSLPVRSPLVRPLRPTRSAPFRNTGNGPVHVADLLSREGHPLAERMNSAREDEADAPGSSRRALGMAAGAMLVIGAVVGGALGLGGGNTSSPTAAGEPVGALPGTGGTVNPGGPAGPASPGGAPAGQDFTNSPAEAKPEPKPEIGKAASIKPPSDVQVNSPRPVQQAPTPAPPPQQQQRVNPAPQQPSQGPVGTLAAPVTETVSPTLSDAVAPVTDTVDDTLQPALSLIGGLLGR